MSQPANPEERITLRYRMALDLGGVRTADVDSVVERLRSVGTTTDVDWVGHKVVWILETDDERDLWDLRDEVEEMREELADGYGVAFVDQRPVPFDQEAGEP